MAKLNGVKVIDMVAGTVEKVAFEGAEYVRVEGPQKGDIGLFNSTNNTFNGQYSEILDVDEDGDPVVCGEHWSHWYAKHLDYFRKVETAAPSSDLESRVEALESDVAALQKRADSEVEGETDSGKEAPKFKAGDKVRGISNGKIYTLKARDYDEDDKGHGIAWSTEESMFGWLGEDQVELVEEEKSEAPLKVGDYAKVTSVKDIDGDIRDHITLGEIVKIVEDDKSRIPFRAEELDGNDYHWFRAEALVRATDAEVAEAKAALAPKFAVGDYAKVVGETYHSDAKTGDIVKVERGIDSDGNYKIRLLDDSDYDFAKPASLEKVSAEEASKFEEESAKKAKWAKIGRDVDEYKEGDIVHGESWSKGHVSGEVEDVGSGIVGVRVFNGRYAGMDTSEATLVTPVESRFDRQ